MPVELKSPLSEFCALSLKLTILMLKLQVGCPSVGVRYLYAEVGYLSAVFHHPSVGVRYLYAGVGYLSAVFHHPSAGVEYS